MTMTTRTLTRIIGSSLIIGTTMVNCSGAQMQSRPAIASMQSSGIASQIEASLAARDFARALLNAERLVEAKPRDAAYRTLLGRAYLANGRFQSAQTAFEDALTLGARDARTIISLALVRTGMGQASEARALLGEHISDIPASDYGLAMAVSGDANEGVRALLEAVHMPDADVKTRQNLAYALGLTGNWAQARLVAGQDLTGNALQQRIAQWVATSPVDAYPQRIAALVGVAPRGDDAGQPARLALATSAGTALASAEPQSNDLVASAIASSEPQPLPAPPAPMENAPAPAAVASAEPEAPTPTVAETAFAAQPEAPVIHASSDPMRKAVMAKFAAPVAAAHTGLTLPARLASTAPHGGSDWVVQIGAFRDTRSAAFGWKHAHGKAFEQNGYRKALGTIALGGKTYYRLAMSGFGNRGAADQLCSSLRSQGQSCFVRHDAGVAADIRMARSAPLKAKAPKTALAAPIKARAEKIASR